MKTVFLVLSVLLVPAIASADALPECPPGTIFRENPIEPGAMHHSGGECVAEEEESASNPSGGGCAVGPARSSGALALGLLAAALLALRRR